MLSGVYRFKVTDALSYEPVSNMVGDYTISAKEMGTWKSDSNGQVYLEHLKVGLTNIQVKDNPDYFNILLNGAKVTKQSNI